MIEKWKKAKHLEVSHWVDDVATIRVLVSTLTRYAPYLP